MELPSFDTPLNISEPPKFPELLLSWRLNRKERKSQILPIKRREKRSPENEVAIRG